MVKIFRETQLQNTNIFHCKQMRIGHIFFLKDDIACLLPPFSSRIPSNLGLHRSHGCCHNEVICVAILLYLEDTVSVESCITSGSYSLSPCSLAELSGPWQEEFGEDIPFRTEFSKSLCLDIVQM